MLGVQLILDYLLRTDIQTCHLVHGYNTLSSNMDCEVALSLEYSASCVEILGMAEIESCFCAKSLNTFVKIPSYINTYPLLGILNIVLGEEVNA